jgi:hypothetical protein
LTASENGNASAASRAIPPSAPTFSRASTKEAYARKKAARLADQDYESGGDVSFEVIATSEIPLDNKRKSLVAWRVTHPHVLDPANCLF